MSWTKVLSVDSLAPGARQVVKVGDTSILVINNNGQLHAVGNRCPHLKLSMTKGKITEDGAIVCPWHRSSFDLCTGAVKDWITWPPVVNKAMAAVSQPEGLPIYPLRIEDGSIWIDA